jgi:hypothetical protein
MMVIKIRMTMAWSWKKVSCSIVGEDLSWNERAIHLGIRVFFSERLFG